MKFHCDQCKTRYSIADDKVRGKILKIRCKNCSAVITICEPKAAASVPAAQPSALRGAFSRAMQKSPTAAMPVAQPPTMPAAAGPKPPPSPVDEWYLSAAGGQEGPFDLDAARRRVSQMVPGEELFAWQESFDDWSPVEEVAQLRASVPAAPPATSLEDDGLFAPSSSVGGSGEVDHRPELPEPSLELAVGDVSRVVRMPFVPGAVGLEGKVPARERGAANRLPGVGSRGNGATPRAAAAAAAARQPGGEPAAVFDEHLDAPWTAREGRRSIGLMLLVSAGVLLVAAAGVLIYLGTRDDGTERRGRRASTQFATDYYKDKESTHRMGRGGRSAKADESEKRFSGGSRSGGSRRAGGGRVERAGGKTTLPDGKVDTFVDEPTNEVLTELTPEEVSSAYRKNKFGMKWCYNRILKRDPEIRVPKMSVTVTIDPSGRVSKIKLPRQNEPLGVCLTNKIKRWRFRKSTGDFTTQFELVFQH